MSGLSMAVALLALSLGASSSAHGESGSAGERRPLPADTVTQSFDISGVHVILRRTIANEVVAVNLYLLGGARQINAQNAGIEPMLLELSERGTRRFGKDQLRRTMARFGSSISIEANPDWTMFGLRTVREVFDSTWPVFAERVTHPRFDSREVELVREQFLSAARQRRDSPDAFVSYLADSAAYAGHPYGLATTGTEPSLSRITARELSEYQAAQMVTSRMLLVIVGDVDRDRVTRLVGQTIGQLPRGTYRWTLPSAPAPIGTGLLSEHRVLPTNYILGYFHGPAATSADYQALRIAAAVLSGRMFDEIRSRQTLTYAVEAPFIERALSTGGLYVSTAYPETTLVLMRHEIARLRRDLISAEGLERLVQQFITEYFLDNETNAQQATLLARAQLYRGDYRVAERFVDELRRVTPLDVRRVTRQYVQNIRFAYVGDTTKLRASALAGF